MKEIKEFKSLIRALINAGSNPCAERDIRRAYWQETGLNVDAVLRKVGGPPFISFLQMSCKDFCQVVPEQRGYSKIYRKSCEKTKHLDHFTRAGERNFQKQCQPSYNQPQALQQNFHNYEITANYFREINAIQCLLGAINHNQRVYSANMTCLSNPYTTLPVMEIALQGIQTSAANILSMTLSYSELVTRAVLRNQHVAQEKPENLFRSVESQIIDMNTLEKELKQEATDPQAITYENVCEEIELSPKILEKDTVIDIHIVSVEPLFKFTFTYDDQALAKLMEELQNQYSSEESDLKINQQAVQPGAVVAAKMFDVWHRAKVISGVDEENSLDVQFIDFGTFRKVPLKDIRSLNDKFKQDPVKFLHGQCFLSPEVSSKPQAQKFFADNAVNKKLYGKVVECSEDLCTMKVYDIDGNDFFSDLLK